MIKSLVLDVPVFNSISVSRVVDLRTGGRWMDPRLGQYAFPGLMIVIAKGFIPLSPLSVVSTNVESSHWLKEFQESIDRCTGCHDDTVENSIKHQAVNQSINLSLYYTISTCNDPEKETFKKTL